MSAKCYVKVGDMTWPNPADPNEVAWRLRHAPESITAADRMHAASVMDAYQQMIEDPVSKRQMVIREIRAANREVES